MADTSKVYFNGINALTGEYGIPPIDYAQIASVVRGETQAEGLKNWIAKQHQKRQPAFKLPFTLDLTDITKVGWAIAFHQDEDETIKQALAPLIEHRRQQINNDKILKILEYRSNEEVADWLIRHGVTDSNVIPTKVPYYILLVGSPEKIPFLFGYLLDAEYAVGRIHFDAVDGYQAYVASLIEYETRPSLSNTKSVTFFAPRHNFDRATQLSSDSLVDPLASLFNTAVDNLPDLIPYGFAAKTYQKATAIKSNAIEIFKSSQPTSILFTASHGLEFSLPTDATDEQKQQIKLHQPQEQGALVCQDWPGFGSIKPEHYFSASDLPSDARLQGMITFHFACFGGGTPSLNRFLKFEQTFGGTATTTLAERPFFAALPKALLSHPQGGALASIAHVERAWGCSFIHPQVGEQLLPFANAIGLIIAGKPIGFAMDDFNRRYFHLSAMLTAKLENSLNKPISDEELAQDWLERNDAESYVIIGDPAVRLRVDLLQQPI
jgi:Peptidase family C25